MPNTYSVLYIEDDPSSAEILSLYLQHQSLNVVHCDNVDDAVRALNNFTFHLAILDIMLPGGDGRDILKKTVSQNIPTIMVTAKVAESDRLTGFDLGADDYICKPYSPREVISRVQALLKRSYKGHQNNVLHYAHLSLDVTYKTVHLGEEPVSLTSVEFALLETLATTPNKVFSREQLIESIWGNDSEVTDRAVDTHMANLRKKLTDNKKDPQFIATRYGQGYQFIAKKSVP